MNKNKLVIMVAIILLCIVGIVFLKTRTKEVVVITRIAEKKTNGSYEIYNTDIDTKSGETKIIATIKNVSGEQMPEQMIDIVLIDKEQNEMGTIKTAIPSLENGDTTEISAESLKVYDKVYDFKIK